MEVIILQFNKQQQQAINFYKGSCSVIAGAGSGKSSVLVYRIKNLIEKYHVNESDILAISFTRNTANDLKKKLSKMGYTNVNVGTFHSICGNILFNNNIDVSNLIKDWQIENCFKNIDKKANIKEIQSFIGYQKSYFKTYKDSFMPKDSNYTETELRKFYKEYEIFKQKNRLYDFDDWLIECYKLLQKTKITYDFILVDEYQDTNLIQSLILKQLCESGNIFVVGDYRQAIYSFRGGIPELFMNFHKEWKNTTIINMNINYRSCDNIVKNSNKFIKNYYGDYKYYSDSIANNKNNGNIFINSYLSKEDEAVEVVDKIEELLKNKVKPCEIAVLYRLNSHSGNIENELKKRRIGYDIDNDSSFFKRKEISTIISYLRLIDNQDDDGALENIYNNRNYPLTYFSKSVFNNIKSYASKNDLSIYEALLSFEYDKVWQKQNINTFKDNISRLKLQYDKELNIDRLIDNIVNVFKIKDLIQEKYNDSEDYEDRISSIETLKTFIKGNDISKFISYIDSNSNTNNKKKDENIKLMTVHKSKGLEFKNVFIISIEDGKFPHIKSPIEDEARLFYVGITRAKENLYITQIGNDNKFINQYGN